MAIIRILLIALSLQVSAYAQAQTYPDRTIRILVGFTPGSAYSYSNSGYYLLAQIVKRVTGQSLREFADARIFKPLGMVVPVGAKG